LRVFELRFKAYCAVAYMQQDRKYTTKELQEFNLFKRKTEKKIHAKTKHCTIPIGNVVNVLRWYYKKKHFFAYSE